MADATVAIRLAPSVAAVYSTRGLAYVKLGELSKAVADYAEALRLNPHDGEGHWGRGVAYEQMGEHEKAIADFADAMRLAMPTAAGGQGVSADTGSGSSLTVDGGPAVGYFAGSAGEPPADYLWLPVYFHLGDQEIRKDIRLSAEQMKTLREIMGRYEAEIRKHYAFCEKLRPSEIKAREAEFEEGGAMESRVL